MEYPRRVVPAAQQFGENRHREMGMWIHGMGQTRPRSECRAPLIMFRRKNPSQRLVKTRVVQADTKQVAAEYRCTRRQLSGAATTLRR